MDSLLESRLLWAVPANLPLLFWVLKRKHLSVSGIAAAATIGVAFFIVHPLVWLSIVSFFASSSILTRFKRSSLAKTQVSHMFQKGGKRDAGQVLANGGGALLIVIIIVLRAGNVLENFEISALTVALVASIAAANSDTWATEIGVLSGSEPRFILNLRKRVPRGTSGGVSLLGSTSAFLGAAVIAIVAALGIITELVVEGDSLTVATFLELGVFIGIAAICGTAGQFIDCVLGATIQGFYHCPKCNINTEKRLHLKCGGTPTSLIRGKTWIDNDCVNAACTLSGALFGLLFGYFAF